jgi:hypothetical protein
VTGEEVDVLHPGMASELARLESEERRRGAARDRTGRSTEPEWRWSVAGAIGLLALVLVGPVATILACAALVAIALLVARGSARDRVPSGPEARDRWAAWRVAEADAEERRQHAA